MKMIKGVLILTLLMTLTLCVLNIAAASSMNTWQPRSGSSVNNSTYHFREMIPDGVGGVKNDYPPVVAVQQQFSVLGTLLKNNTTGVKVGYTGATALYHGEVIDNVPNPTLWKVKTNKVGNFRDTFYFQTQGRHDIIYTYMYGDNMADFCQSNVISIYAVLSNSNV